ncbi:efflux RND transporter permease subunit [Gimesia panareensis]|uniref:efflux RND transporter permease subunit n=1 Tax=Gimesia panareensis TaxID=2527978 RepID=UPI00118C1A6D|nr:efflux RND transporter permease subunit [Gimesia panareensis]QDU49701.1 Multidrug resistance protein MdtB [Gimesia panareensis]
MKSVIKWAINNSPAMNTLMVTVLGVGLVSLMFMRREVFPEFELEIILVAVPYPGASPDEVEEGICQKMEEAVRAIDGIKKITSIASEGSGSLVLELRADVPDVQKILNEVRSEIDRIPSFPELAEDPEIQQITFRQVAIEVAVIGPGNEDANSELELREVTEKIRDKLLQLKSVSQANITGARDYQIDIEIPEATLRKYGLTLQDVARTVRRENLELPGGKMNTRSQVLLVRGKNKHLIGREIEKIPLVTEPGGVVLTVDDLGNVHDEFADTTMISEINGKPAMSIAVERTSQEDLLAIVEEVREFVKNTKLPDGYTLKLWKDQSIDVRDRMELLSRNGLQGLILVFITLAIFLELRLAFWVALGIPISMFGACIVLYYTGQTLNMLSMFAFLMALGIIVDDAIVVGENIYEHRQMGKSFVVAAVDGAAEVLPSVCASVTTTIIAFAPLLFVSGIMGKFIAVMPIAVIAMLIISLLESTFILPCHLAHGKVSKSGGREGESEGFVGRKLNAFIEKCYTPVLKASLNYPSSTLAVAAALMLISAGLIMGGFAPFNLFPKTDFRMIEAIVEFPDGTPQSITDAATRKIQQDFLDLDQEYQQQHGNSLVKLTRRNVGFGTREESGARLGGTVEGSHIGKVSIEIVEAEERTLGSEELLERWRERVGEVPGVDRLTFKSPSMGPGGKPIEFKLLSDANHLAELEAAVEDCKRELETYPGVKDVNDDSSPGKWEFQIKIKDKARAMGVPLADVAETVRATYYGEEVMRLQRGRHEVKLMVRYPEDERRSLMSFDDIRIRTGDGAERPLTELADVAVKRGYSEINRIDQQRSITVYSDLNEKEGNAREIVKSLKKPGGFMEELAAKYPNVRVRWEGQQEQTNESVNSLIIGLMIALASMFALLTIEFRSYIQPLIILGIIPFGIIGAVFGHAILGMELTLFSLFGLVALTGVVVNDSIVLIDFINHRVADGLPLKEALIDAGRRRFRPVLLTSMTTIVGLAPILKETSFQAQIIIPMAASLIFGLMLATVLVLFLIPTYYYLYARFMGAQPNEPWYDKMDGKHEGTDYNDSELQHSGAAPLQA